MKRWSPGSCSGASNEGLTSFSLMCNDVIMITEMESWFRGRLPDDWFTDIEIQVDRDEIVLIGTLEVPTLSEDAGTEDSAIACTSRIEGFREDTRRQRMKIADEAQRKFDRKVSWGARCGEVGIIFTHLAVPAMTRLRMRERKVLDTLIDGGIARSRSEALAWCVRLVGRHETEWIEELRQALVAVEDVRDRSPLD